MILYVNGDSHSYGHDAGGPEFSYGNYLARHLNAKFICDAVSGCDNASIISRTKEFLLKTKPDFIIIGWTSWEREAWTYNNFTYYVTSSGYDMLPLFLKQRYKEFVINSADPEFRKEKQKYWHEQIVLFHNFLLNEKIKHLFFNCYSYFQHIEEKYDWNDCYIDPYTERAGYYFWLEDRGYRPSNPKYYHYGSDAHRAWANFLLPKTQSKLTNN